MDGARDDWRESVRASRCPQFPNHSLDHPTVLTNLGLTAYWLYPNADGVPVTYSYCASTSILDTADEQCSETTTATFTVVGPTATITPVLSLQGDPVFSTGQWSVTSGYTGCTDNPAGELTQFLAFGQYNAPPADCTQSVSIPGIVFAATDIDTDNVTAPNANFLWVQLITGGQVSGTGPSATTTPEGSGLDNFYPYATSSPSGYVGTEDSPGVALINTWTTEARAFTAQMYLLWNSNLDPTAIAVPIGYLTWSINGTANNNTTSTPPWSLSISTVPSTATTTYTQSTDIGAPSHGLPVWTNILYNTASTTSESESVPTDGEEENKQ